MSLLVSQTSAPQIPSATTAGSGGSGDVTMSDVPVVPAGATGELDIKALFKEFFNGCGEIGTTLANMQVFCASKGVNGDAVKQVWDNMVDACDLFTTIDDDHYTLNE